MATYSTGITATWNGTAFQEVTGLTWSWGGGPARGRATRWTDSLGTVTVECLGAANTATTNYGLRADLSISGGGNSLTTPAIWESLGVANEVNGVVRFTVTLRITDI